MFIYLFKWEKSRVVQDDISFIYHKTIFYSEYILFRHRRFYSCQEVLQRKGS